MADLDCSSVVLDIEEAYDSIQRGNSYISSGANIERNPKIESRSRIEIENSGFSYFGASKISRKMAVA